LRSESATNRSSPATAIPSGPSNRSAELAMTLSSAAVGALKLAGASCPHAHGALG